ncbi:MAG: ABC transporter permease [Paracoccaceae bacterium]
MGKTLHKIGAGDRGLRGVVLGIAGIGLIGPIALGFLETARAAFGIFPALGHEALSLDPWRQLFALPGFATSLRLTLITGFGSTLIALVLAVAVCAALFGKGGLNRLARGIAPLLAIPHAAMAVGLVFVLSPSGWIARLVAPWAGWTVPPDLASVNDANGLALMLGLVVKELPFLLLVMVAGLGQIDATRQIAAARALGHARAAAFIKVALPQLWPMIRLPVWVVLAYALSVVDMALILGPSNPPTLAVAVTRWFTDPQAALILPASAGALLQALVVVAGILLLWLLERSVGWFGLFWLRQGGRGQALSRLLHLTAGWAGLLANLSLLAMIALLVWSLAWRWPWPMILPESWSLAVWSGGDGWLRALGHTLVLAGVTVTLSLLLAIAWLESEDRARRGSAGWAQALIYLPLILPQIGFLYGLNVAFLSAGVAGGMAAVVWAQTLFVFPYVMIALSDPWRALDRRMVQAAAGLGAGPWRRLVALKLPMLLRPILTAAAIGVAVSVAQYLPTLFMGAGRIPTLTTEAVTLSSGSDRRVTAVYATLQAVVPLVAYLAAAMIPVVIHRNRRGLWS